MDSSLKLKSQIFPPLFYISKMKNEKNPQLYFGAKLSKQKIAFGSQKFGFDLVRLVTLLKDSKAWNV